MIPKGLLRNVINSPAEVSRWRSRLPLEALLRLLRWAGDKTYLVISHPNWARFLFSAHVTGGSRLRGTKTAGMEEYHS